MKRVEGLRLADAYLKSMGLEGIDLPPAPSQASKVVEIPVYETPMCEACGARSQTQQQSILHLDPRFLCWKCAEAEVVMCVSSLEGGAVKKKRGSVLVEYLLLVGSSILIATAALAALKQVTDGLLEQILR